MKQLRVLIFIIIFSTINLFAKEKTLHFNTQEFPPFNYSFNKKAAGPIVEIINHVCKKIEIKCVHRVLPWRRAQKEVRLGLADALYVIGKNKSRESWLHFSLPILTTEYGFFVLKLNQLSYKDISDVQGYNIGVYGPSNTSDSLNKIGVKLVQKGLSPIDITMSYDDVLSFKMLNKKTRNLQSVYSNKDVGNKIIKNYNLNNLKYLGTHKTLNYYIGFSKSTVSKEIVSQFNNILAQMYQHKELQTFLAQYNLKSATLK